MLKKIAKYISVIASLCLAAYFLNPQKVWLSLNTASPKIIAITVLLILFCFVAAGARWSVICRGIGIPSIDTWKKIKLNHASSFVDMMLPIYGGSDAFCAIAVASTRNECGWKAASSIIISRAIGYLFAILIAATICSSQDIPTEWKIAIISIAVFSLIVISILPRLTKRMPEILQSLKDIPIYDPTMKKTWIKAFILTAISQGLLITSRAWLGWELGVDLTWLQYAFISSAILVLTPFVPSFGFIGLGTATFVTFSAYFGADPEAAAALSIAWYGCWVIAIAPGIIFFKEVNGKEIMEKISTKTRKMIAESHKTQISPDKISN